MSVMEKDMEGSINSHEILNLAKWMKLFAITSLIGCGIVVLFVLYSISGLFALIRFAPQIGIILLLYVAILGFGVYLLYTLLQLSQLYEKYGNGGSSEDLELAFAKQQFFWKMVGYTLIASIVLGIIFVAMLMSSGGSMMRNFR